MFDFRLKHVQVALADGRLDEAYELIKDSSLWEHRSGQKLVAKLSQAFILRGQAHLAAERLAPALEDCLHAEKLAGNLPEIGELRSKICEHIESERAQMQQQAEQLEKAKQQMQNGWLSTGRKILAETDDYQAQCLLKNADMLELETESAVGRIKQALKVGQVELAARIFQNSSLCNGLNPEAADVLDRIQQQAFKKLQDYLLEGHLHLASSFLNQLQGSVAQCDTIGTLRQATEYCHRAVKQIEAGNFAAVGVSLQKVKTLLPKAKWVTEVIRQSQSAADAQQNLQAGPLGILENIDLSEISKGVAATPKTKQKAAERLNIPRIDPYNGMGTKMRFILQLDGIGAYHVLCNDCVTMGPVSSSIRSDIELVMAPDIRPMQIERGDGDYFLGQVDHPGTSLSSKNLLNDGDRVELSPRCRFKFTLPNPASSTACLIPSSARFPRADISGVILLDRELLIGPERNNHIQSGQVPEAIVLFLQDKQIRCRSNQPVYVDGCALAAGEALPIDKQIEIGDVRFSLSTYKT